ncbi:Hpt domain-containing protein [Arthrobacter sp. H35-D1]|uniref:Hpt domain-containing protein n=1 Tax=Arthrobacter sp. H35-D1 TaxID=3046202 RepID=UPI0024BBABBE|nr:Hpt domain-containing protein [Arthrobacter sp. H35-D1]MDJ0313998.1 Hpt domain-containing protein [Arthrobacter sp. H35-D1]
MAHTELPLVDTEALQALEDSLQGQKPPALEFVRSFAKMWPQRFERIRGAVDSCEWAKAVDAAISLYSSSSMAGVPRLSRLAAELVQLLKRGHYIKAATMLDQLHRCGDQTVAQLVASYLRQG